MPNAYVINTNLSHSPTCEKDMLTKEKCAAYYSPWKYHINMIQPNDMVFLYSNGKGIIARGIASGIVEIKDYENCIDEEHYMKLYFFEELDKPVTASELKEFMRSIDPKYNIIFATTMFSFPDVFGVPLWRKISKEHLNANTISTK